MLSCQNIDQVGLFGFLNLRLSARLWFRKRTPNIRHIFPVYPTFPMLDWIIDGFTMLLISERVPPHDLLVEEGDRNFETMCYFLATFGISDIGQNTEDKWI